MAIWSEPQSNSSLGEEALAGMASDALEQGEEELAIPAIRAGAERYGSALLWHWTGLLQRAIDEHEAALDSLRRSADLAPADPKIAHAHARVALEAGVDAVDLFERARTLAPADPHVLFGLAAARLASGDGARAAAELAEVVRQVPRWADGHLQLAQLLAMLGRREEATRSIEEAIAASPRDPLLWSTILAIDLRREDYARLAEDIEHARAAGVPEPALAVHAAIAAAELDGSVHPGALFDRAPPDADPTLAIWRIRHLLRVGAVDEAIAHIDAELATDRAPQTWPYAAIAWRLAGDARCEWLEGDDRFVSVIDLAADLPPLDRLAHMLQRLHVARGEYLDQSVRGGTQTDGPLFSRIEPEIRAVRSAVVAAVQRHVERLPPGDAGHPVLAPRRDRRIRFSGSWSVWLRSGGRHSNHVHPQGWISSALYVALPPPAEGAPEDAGWLTLGEPDDRLGVDLPPFRKIEPRPGQLVLFPSYMWHGTVPFGEGARLTMAFDVAPPR